MWAAGSKRQRSSGRASGQPVSRDDDRRAQLPGLRGFTLVEILVVVVIALAVTAVSVPLFSGTIKRVQLRGAATELAASLRYARSRAITSSQETALRVDLTERRYAIVGSSEPAARLDKAYDLKLTTGDFAGLGEDEGEVRFFPDGSSSGGEIKLTLGGKGYAVRVEWLTGRIAILEAVESGDG